MTDNAQFGRHGPPPHEPFESVLRFRVAVLTIGHRGPPHPSPLPEERERRRRRLFPSMVQRHNAPACVGVGYKQVIPTGLTKSTRDGKAITLTAFSLGIIQRFH